MAEYDAFGRKKGDDPLEQLSSTPPPAGPAPPPVMPARRKGFAVAVAIALVVVLASVGIAISLLAGSVEGGLEPVAVEDAPDAPQTSLPEAVPPATDAPARAGLEEGSLLTRAALAPAVEALRSADLGRPLSLRVAADRIDASLIDGEGDLRIVQVRPGGAPRVLSTVDAGPSPSIPWSAVDPAAPERLVRAAAEREERSAGDVDYLVLMPLKEPTWGLFFKGGTHYQGDATGSLTRRVTP